MQSQLPARSFVWGALRLRFQSELTVRKLEICRLAGLSEDSGSTDSNVNRELEEKQTIDELTVLLVQAVDELVVGREISDSSE
jgi:hypothetical protein